jgi:predicted PurR-regulated permease PerM
MVDQKAIEVDIEASNQSQSLKSQNDPKIYGLVVNDFIKTEKLVRGVLVLLFTLLLLVLISISWNIVSAFSNQILLFLAGYMLALLLGTPVNAMIAMNIPKPLAITLAYLLMLGAISLLLALFLPGLIEQTQQLSNSLTGILNSIQVTVNDFLRGFGAGPLDFQQFTTQLEAFGNDVLRAALNTATGIPGFLLSIFLTLIISASFLASRRYTFEKSPPHTSENSPARTISYLPGRARDWLVFLQDSFERNFGVFLGGQIVVGIIYGIVVGIVMSIGGYSYSSTTAVMCGVLMIIPFFGGPLSLIPPAIAGFGSTAAWMPLWLMLLIIGAIQGLLVNILLPRLIGRGSGLGPLLTLFVLLAGTQVGGIWGVILGVPLVSVGKNVIDKLLKEAETRSEALELQRQQRDRTRSQLELEKTEQRK